MTRSFLTCPHPHGRIQQYTEICFDCGCNVNLTVEEYAVELRNRACTQESNSEKDARGVFEAERREIWRLQWEVMQKNLDETAYQAQMQELEGRLRRVHEKDKDALMPGIKLLEVDLGITK
jgi:hypothetical protein